MNRISVVMDPTLADVSHDCTASKITLLQWCITSAALPIIFVEFFYEKYLLAMDKYMYILVIPARLHHMQVKHAHDAKLKINKLRIACKRML